MAGKRKLKVELEAEIKDLRRQVYVLAMKPESHEALVIRLGYNMNDQIEKAMWAGRMYDSNNSEIRFQGMLIQSAAGNGK